MSSINNIQQKRRDAIKGLNPIKSSQRYKYSLKDVKAGGYISFNNENYLVKSLSRYLETKWSFKKKKNDYYVTELELFSLKTGEVLFMEWEFDDELEIYVTQKEIKLKDLTSSGSKKVSKSILEDIAEEEEGEIQYNSQKYYYIEDDTWAALYFKDANSEGIPVRFYEFESDNEEYITIEMWYDEVGDDRPEREAFISQEVSPKEIEILQLDINKK